MKSYENKKIYNFKTKHKRKRRIGNTQIWPRNGSSWYIKKSKNNWYLKYKKQKYRCRCKEVLRKKLQGRNIEFPLYRTTKWWDS